MNANDKNSKECTQAIIDSNRFHLNRHELVSFVRKWGDVNTEGLLSSTCQYYTKPNIEGFIGYRIEAGNAVVYGDPVCQITDKSTLANAFQQHCRKQQLGVVYIIASAEFSHWAAQNQNAVLIEFGKKFLLNPQINPADQVGPKAGLVRNRVNHALNEKTYVLEYCNDNPSLEKTLQDIASTWQQKRQGPQIYLADFTLFNDREGKRWFYAKKDEIIVGILLLSKIKSTNGWLIRVYSETITY